MKVTLISGSMPPLKCGIGFYTNNLIDELHKNSQLSLITTIGLNTHTAINETHYLKNWKIYQLSTLVKLVKKTQPEIVHIQYPAAGYRRNLGINFLPLMLRIFLPKAKIVITLHEYFGSGILGKTRNRITAICAHKIFVSNPYDLKALPIGLRKKTVVVPIGSNIPIAKQNTLVYENIIKAGGFTNKPALFFGFPFANKGIEKLIEAARFGHFGVLFLCGIDKNDAYQAGLLQKINSAIAQGARLHVAGFLSDEVVSLVMQESEVFVLPQTIPLTAKSGTAIAAVNHGLAVVSRAAKTPDLNMPYVNDENSILIKNMTAENLSIAIVSMLNDVPKRKKILSEAKKLSEYFSWKNIATQHVKEYEKLLK